MVMSMIKLPIMKDKLAQEVIEELVLNKKEFLEQVPVALASVHHSLSTSELV